VVESCALTRDLEILPGGAECEIGERGVSISGGQQARVGLGRAVYRDADLYLMDDVLQAVDVHVGAHIFEEALLKRLAGKTRILVTHQYRTLPHADLILYFEDGKIVKSGSYQELVDQGVKLLELVKEMDAQAREHVKEMNKSTSSLGKSTSSLNKSGNSLTNSSNSVGVDNLSSSNGSASGAASLIDIVEEENGGVSDLLTESTEVELSEGEKLQIEEQKAEVKSDGGMVEEEERAIGTLKFEVVKMYMADFTWPLVIGCIVAISLVQVRENTLL